MTELSKVAKCNGCNGRNKFSDEGGSRRSQDLGRLRSAPQSLAAPCWQDRACRRAGRGRIRAPRLAYPSISTTAPRNPCSARRCRCRRRPCTCAPAHLTRAVPALCTQLQSTRPTAVSYTISRNDSFRSPQGISWCAHPRRLIFPGAARPSPRAFRAQVHALDRQEIPRRGAPAACRPDHARSGQVLSLRIGRQAAALTSPPSLWL